MVVVNLSLLSADSLAYASVIFSVGLLLLFSSLISICVLINNQSESDVISYYFISLAFSDLLCSVFIVPLSIYSSLVPNWNFMGDNSLLCKSAAYVHVVLVSSAAYTCAWVGVDRYSAFMKPARYEIEHTLTRCKCWIAFSWATAILLACPIIVAKMEVNYYRDFEMCVLNWSTTTTVAYSITLAVLVLLPTVCTVAFTCGSVFAALNKPEELEDSQRTAVYMDENFIVTFFVLITLILIWLPIIVIELLPAYLIHPADLGKMKFIFMWLAIGGSSCKLLVYTIASREFRHSFCSICRCVGRKHSLSERTNSLGGQLMNGLFEAAALGAQTAGKLEESAEYEKDVLVMSNNDANTTYLNHMVLDKNANNTVFSPAYQSQEQKHQQQFLPQRQKHLRILTKHQNESSKMNNLSLNRRAMLNSTAESPIAANLVGHVPEYGSFSISSIPITY